MSQATPPEAGNPAERCVSEDVRDAMWDEHQQNLDYFLKHGLALFEQHQDQWLLIHSGSEVEGFDNLADLFDRCDTFGSVQRGAAMIERRKTGAWIL